jgi:hypothetical protein
MYYESLGILNTSPSIPFDLRDQSPDQILYLDAFILGGGR